jgi:hypothetical protein
VTTPTPDDDLQKKIVSEVNGMEMSLDDMYVDLEKKLKKTLDDDVKFFKTYLQ